MAEQDLAQQEVLAEMGLQVVREVDQQVAAVQVLVQMDRLLLVDQVE
jgi:hypothetical protein